jgi:hypothetical protein
MKPVRDLCGKTFGSLTVLRRVQSDDGKGAWLCECRCGNTKLARTAQLTHGTLRSCGWKCGLRAGNRKKQRASDMPSPHVTVPEREPRIYEGNEDALAAQYGEGSNANV